MICLTEFTFITLMLVGYGACGFPLIAQWQAERRFLFMLSPLVGLLISSTLSLVFYVLLGMAMPLAIATSFILCIAASCICLWKSRPIVDRRDVTICILVALVVSALVTFFCCYATISSAGPAVLCLDGSDQLGYAHIADWLLRHRIVDAPRSDPLFPYESWPAVLFWIDPRAGTFSYVASVSYWSGLSGLFSFDRACAIALAAAAIGVPAIFARRISVYVLLVSALLLSHWFDYSRDGYLAKLVAFPSYLCSTGLFLITVATRWTPLRVFALSVLVVTVALALNGILAAIWLFLAGFVVLLLRYFTKEQTLEECKTNLIWLSLLCLISVVTTGTLARPYAFVSTFGQAMPYGWNRILFINLELENHGQFLSQLPESIVWLIAASSIVAAIVGLCIAIKQRSADSIALFSIPFTIPLLLRLLNAKWLSYSCTGIFYPFGMCALASLVDQKSRQLNSILLVCICALLLGRIPRIVGAVERYASAKTPRLYQFKKQDIERLARLSAKEEMLIDVPIVQHGLVLLVELLRDGHQVEWTPVAYRTVLGYRNWTQPASLGRKPTLKVVLPDSPQGANSVEFQCEQFKVLRMP